MSKCYGCGVDAGRDPQTQRCMNCGRLPKSEDTGLTGSDGLRPQGARERPSPSRAYRRPVDPEPAAEVPVFEGFTRETTHISWPEPVTIVTETIVTEMPDVCSDCGGTGVAENTPQGDILCFTCQPAPDWSPSPARLLEDGTPLHTEIVEIERPRRRESEPVFGSQTLIQYCACDAFMVWCPDFEPRPEFCFFCGALSLG